MLFLLSSLSANLVLLSSVTVFFVYLRDRDSSLTIEEKSIEVYKDMLVIEVITMGISILISIIFGYLYEIWSRKKVLSLSFILLAVGVVLPESGFIEKDGPMYLYGRIATAVFSTTIMANPLLNDYVKKHNRGIGASMQKVGELLGEITAFCILYNGIHYEEESRRIIFFTVGALVFVFGLIVSRLMVRE